MMWVERDRRIEADNDVPVVQLSDVSDEAEVHPAFGLVPAHVERVSHVPRRDGNAVAPPCVCMDSEYHRHAIVGDGDALGEGDRRKR